MELIYFLAQLVFVLALFTLPLALLRPQVLSKSIPRWKQVSLLVLIMVAAFAASVLTQPDYKRQRQEADSKTLYKVTSVIDGDTIRVRINSQIESVRLIGIDAPEVDYENGGHECFAQESAEYVRKLLDDKYVRLEADESQSDRDTHGRLLRYVFTEDETNINQVILAKGYAFESTFDVQYKYQKEFQQAEQTAKDTGKGLWSPDTCNGMGPDS